MRGAVILLLLALSACAAKAPVQEMAEARSAIATAKQLPGDGKGEAVLKSAEQSLQEAAKAMEAQHFDRARRLALEAKRKAQRAARQKQSE